MFHRRRIKIAEILIAQEYISEKQLIRALVEEKKTGRDLTAILVDLGYISKEELTSIIGEQIQLTQRKRLGEVLIERGIITNEQLDEALEMQRITHESIGACLIKLRFVDEERILDALSAQLDTQHVVLDNFSFNEKMLEYIPKDQIEEYGVIPLFLHGNILTIAMSDPTNLRIKDYIRFSTGKEVDVVMASEKGIKEYINKIVNDEFEDNEKINHSLEKVELSEVDIEAVKDVPEPVDYGKKIVDIVNSIVTHAIELKASDIHFEAFGKKLRIRFRIDGVLIEKKSLDIKLMSQVVSRLKILSGIDIAEKRKPQDGKFHITYQNRDIDLRVSTYPSVTRNRGVNEKVVIRIFDSNSNVYSLDTLGIMPDVHKEYEKLLQSSNGIILVTGPTGSGKSSTLYSSLLEVNSPEINIITMEDPVEFTIDGISQGQINNKSGFSFANGMRSILRQDPDVIMIGEIRDKETCEMAIQAALTGHLVFSTLHTNDSATAFTRLIDMGIEPFLITSSVLGVMAQRLVRKICPECKISYTPDNDLLRGLDLPSDTKLYKGKGCGHCNGTGYKGRTGIFELLIPDDEIKQMVMKRSSATEIKVDCNKKKEFYTLRAYAIELLRQGVTSVEEVLLKTDRDEIDASIEGMFL